MALPEEVNNCVTHKTTPSLAGPGDKVQTSTVELDISEAAAADEGRAGEDDAGSPGETAGPSEPQESSRTEPSDEGEEPEPEGEVPEGAAPEGDDAPSGSSSSQSVDELMADWQEDLDAFQQMDEEEL